LNLLWFGLLGSIVFASEPGIRSGYGDGSVIFRSQVGRFERMPSATGRGTIVSCNHRPSRSPALASSAQIPSHSERSATSA
jgi:hypothetical protein